jgi:hypothetical protein
VDLFFNGTLTVDFAEFLTATLKNNSLVTGPGGAQQNMLGVGDDTERVGQSSSSTISGNTLTVGGFVGGSLFEIGQVIQGTGVTAATITAQTSGTTGQNGTYTLSGPSQTISTPQTINATFSSSGILDFENNIWANDNTNNFWGFYLLQVPTWMKSPPDPLTNNEYVAMPYPYSSNKTGGSTGYPDTSQITETGSVSYASRTAAGLPAAPVAPPPPGCTGTVGNMAVP